MKDMHTITSASIVWIYRGEMYLNRSTVPLQEEYDRNYSNRSFAHSFQENGVYHIDEKDSNIRYSDAFRPTPDNTNYYIHARKVSSDIHPYSYYIQTFDTNLELLYWLDYYDFKKRCYENLDGSLNCQGLF